MMNPLAFARLRTPVAVAALLGSALVSAPAHAASFTVFWDREAFGGFPSGYGLTETTALNANSAGIPILSIAAASLQALPSSVPVNHVLDESTLSPPFPIGAGPATITSNWSATNNTGTNAGGTPQTLYVVYERPITNDEHSPPVTYNPADVGITLTNDGNGSGVDWVIFQIPVAGGNSVYYPAVSLGTLADGATAAFPLFYTLNNPQVFTVPQSFNYELGMPKWSLDFVSITAPIPEPSSGVLMLVGLLGIAGGRRKRS
jgi:hypothetical protein